MNKYRVTKSAMTMETFDVEALSEQEAIRLCAGKSGKLVSQVDAWSAVLVGSGKPTLPAGFGVYLRRIGAQDSAEVVAERCVRAGMYWALFMVEASDGHLTDLSVTSAWAKVFRAHGLAIGVWSFPGDSRAASVEQSTAAATLLTTVAQEVGAEAVVLDIEQPYKGHPVTLDALIEAAVSTVPPSAVLGVTSYPVPDFHPTLNWRAFAAFAFGSPMFYQSAQDPQIVKRGYAEWSQYVNVFAPSLDGWSGSGAAGADRFSQDITNVCGPAGDPRVPGALVWSESQMDSAKRLVTKERGVGYGWPQSE